MASLYQIKDFGPQNALLLSEWIYENYKYEQLETVIECLRAPNSRGDKIWRLTPDVIQSWFMAYLDKLSNAREREIHNAKHEKVESEWPQERLQELQEVTLEYIRLALNLAYATDPVSREKCAELCHLVNKSLEEKQLNYFEELDDDNQSAFI